MKKPCRKGRSFPSGTAQGSDGSQELFMHKYANPHLNQQPLLVLWMLQMPLYRSVVGS